MLNLQESYLRQIGSRYLLLRVFDRHLKGESLQRHRHVGLAGGKPDIADEEIAARDG